jgi:hypothetical protein
MVSCNSQNITLLYAVTLKNTDQQAYRTPDALPQAALTKQIPVFLFCAFHSCYGRYRRGISSVKCSAGSYGMRKKLFLFFMLFFTVSCAGPGSVTESTARKPKLQYELYITGIPEEDMEKYLDVMSEQEYYESHKLLRMHADYAEIIYWAKESPERIYEDTRIFFAGDPVVISGRTIFVGREDK